MSADNWTICPKCGDVGDPTFREDWEIGVAEDGEFHVEYTGRCVTCMLSFKFTHQASIPDNRKGR